MTIKRIIEVLDGKLLTPSTDLTTDIDCAFSCDLISDILACAKEPTLILTGLINPQVIRMADMVDILGIVFVRGKVPPQYLIDMADERDLPLISTGMTMFQSSGTLFQNGMRSCRI